MWSRILFDGRSFSNGELPGMALGLQPVREYAVNKGGSTALMFMDQCRKAGLRT
jgi:hypothetical protein